MYLLNNTDSESFDLDTCLRYLEAKHLDNPTNVADSVFYWSIAIKHNIKFAFLISQHFLETGHGTSFWYLQHNNYAGIGVTGDKSTVPVAGYYFDAAKGLYLKGIHYADKIDGLLAHVAHIDSYIFAEPKFNCDTLDLRYKYVRQALASKNLRYADTLEVLAPMYATASDYVQKVTGIYDTIMKYKQ